MGGLDRVSEVYPFCCSIMVGRWISAEEGKAGYWITVVGISCGVPVVSCKRKPGIPAVHFHQ